MNLRNDVKIANFDNARDAGLSVESSVRWALYKEMKSERGEAPIALVDAVEQKRQALARH